MKIATQTKIATPATSVRFMLKADAGADPPRAEYLMRGQRPFSHHWAAAGLAAGSGEGAGFGPRSSSTRA